MPTEYPALPITGRTAQPVESPRLLNVAEAAAILRVDVMTVYRAIRAGEFPAIRMRGRYVIPAKAIDAMIDAAVSTGTVVNAAQWNTGAAS